MPLRTVLLLIVLAAVALFAVLNWSAFLAPTTLSLGVAVVQAPLGLIMLGLIGILTVAFLGLFGTVNHAGKLASVAELMNDLAA